ncbi:hypothetical protein [Pantoea latae]|uniref:DUF2116 family Zn-ribbon domain-containing protein n=1 Tax=Pantoea latae TaxID=1964541 RepID=A0A1V9DJF7_9GAMM|nr:hypothetical protein [Pantoea latae]OQP33884.1 hypothetical protein B2J69_09900 [Pantoea latae]
MNFPDAADEAAAREQQMIEVALANRPRPAVEFTGKCHYCEETISKGHYCDAGCREDHERLLWAQKQRSVA